MDITKPIIGYQPLPGEVNYRSYFSAGRCLILPNATGTDPFAWASKCVERFRQITPNMLIPGTKFDWTGTRWGRGAGWYDRFLSAIPSDWVRIGVADITQLSPVYLERRPWDQPVDWLLIKDGVSWIVHETRARQPEKL